MNEEQHEQPQPQPRRSDDELQAQINAIVESRANHGKQQDLSSFSDNELKQQIHTIVGGHAAYRKQCDEYMLQLQATKALAAAQERNQHRTQFDASIAPDVASYAIQLQATNAL